MKPDIYKIKILGSGYLAVMAKPISGEWIEDEFKSIANENIKQIVSLLEVREAYEVGFKDERKLSEKNGIEFISYPIKDRSLPTSAKEFGEFTKKLYYQVSNGINTVIHCRAGIGRYRNGGFWCFTAPRYKNRGSI